MIYDEKDLIGIRVLIVFVMILIVLCASFACTTNHYFSINAEEITNPSIEYHDSTSVYNPF